MMVGQRSADANDGNRLLTPARMPEDVDATLRPKSLDEFVGQQALRENLRIFINTVKARSDALDRVLSRRSGKRGGGSRGRARRRCHA